MKIFISHSSREKWIARKISEELIAKGYNTFLDEKDISTGQSISKSIHNELEDSDDFLILLSEQSLKSTWVLIELGGAIALKKNIIPILLFIGPYEIPDVISNHLARDINDISKYYDELEKRLKGGFVKKNSVLKSPVERTKFAVGQLVKISENPNQETIGETDWNADGKMDKYKSIKTRITEVDPIYGTEPLNNTYKIEADNGKFYWRKDWLIPISQ